MPESELVDEDECVEDVPMLFKKIRAFVGGGGGVAVAPCVIVEWNEYGSTLATFFVGRAGTIGSMSIERWKR